MTGSRIRNIRRELHLSQSQFADLLGRNRMTVFRWETDRAVPDSREKELLICCGKAASNVENIGVVARKVMESGDLPRALLLLLTAAIVPYQDVLDLMLDPPVIT